MKRALRLGASALLVGAGLAAPAGGPAGAADDVTLTLVSQPLTILAGEPWTATFDVAGDLGVPPAATATAPTPTVPPASTPATHLIQARVRAHRLVDDRAGLSAALEGARPPVVSRLTVPVSVTGTGDATSFEVSVATATDPNTEGALILSRAGLYPVTVDLVVDGDVVASHRTFVERLPVTAVGDDTAMHVAVVASVDDPGPEPAPDVLEDAQRAIDGIAAAAAALDGRMTVQLPPSVVAGLDPTSLGVLRTSLTGAELLSVPALALDASSAVAADQADTFSRQLREGEDLLGEALPDSPPQRSAWLVGPPLSAPAATVLREPLGYDVLVFSPDVYNELEGSIGGYHDPTLAFGVDLDDDVTLPGLLVNPASRWLDPAELADHDMSGTDGAIAIMAELRVTRSELGDELRRSAVLQTAPGVAPDPEVLASFASLAATTPDIELATLAELPAATDIQEISDSPEAVRLPADAGTDLAERAGRIELTKINATGAGSMLVDQSRAVAWDAELDELLSTALDDDAVDARLARISGEAQAIYTCVVTPNPFTFTLTGRSSTLRLNLTNACDDDLRVVVHPTSSKLTFPNGDVARTLAANSVTEVEIEVESRTNGTSAIGVELLTPVGSLPLREPLVLTARVNALSGLGQLVTGGALLVLVSWWYGHFRRRRRVRRAMIGEVDNPVNVGEAVSPDAAEVTVAAPAAEHEPQR